MTDLLKTGSFEVDHTVHLDSGGSIRLVVEADLLVTKKDELDFVLGMVNAVREFEETRGVDLEHDHGGEEGDDFDG